MAVGCPWVTIRCTNLSGGVKCIIVRLKLCTPDLSILCSKPISSCTFLLPASRYHSLCLSHHPYHRTCLPRMTIAPFIAHTIMIPDLSFVSPPVVLVSSPYTSHLPPAHAYCSFPRLSYYDNHLIVCFITRRVCPIIPSTASAPAHDYCTVHGPFYYDNILVVCVISRRVSFITLYLAPACRSCLLLLLPSVLL